MALRPSRPLDERLVFSSPTTYSDAYNNILRGEKDILEPERVCTVPPACFHTDPMGRKKKQPPGFYSNETKHIANLTVYKKPVRFDLMINLKPKDIIRTNPQDIQQPFIPDKVDKQKDFVRRTRPRVVMTPAVSLDDVEDQVLRDTWLESVYTTTSLRAAKEIFTVPVAVKAPVQQNLATSLPVHLPKLKPKVISEEWRWDAVFWDLRQVRGDCDVDKEFWTRRKTTLYSAKKS